MQNALVREAPPAKRQLIGRFFGGAEDATGGSAAVELGFVAPILLLMMVSTVDFGMGFYRKMQVEEAAQAGAQYAMLNTFDSAKIKNAVTSATSPSSRNSWAIEASPEPSRFCGCATSTGVTNAAAYSSPCPPPPCSDGTTAGTYVTVSAKGTYKTILPYPRIPASFAFKAQATVRIQ